MTGPAPSLFDTVHVDWETYSETDLPSCGLDRYTSDPTFEIIKGGWAINDEPPQLWFPRYQPIPERLRDALLNPHVIKKAWNAQFERVCLWKDKRIQLHVPASEWRCSMVGALMLALPGKLDECGKVLDLGPEFAKSEGKKYINLFCKPHAPTKRHPYTRYDEFSHPVEWAEFGRYCLQDVVAERKIDRLLARFPVPERMWKLYALDQKINDRGLPIDLLFVKNAIEFARRHKRDLIREMNQITGLKNANSTSQLLPWARERGYPFNSLEKNRLKKGIEDFEFNMEADCLRVLKLRQTAAKTSTNKYTAILRRVGLDGRLRYCFQMAGAGRTNRFAGRGVQTQNFPRPAKEYEPFLAAIRQMVRDGDYDFLKALFDNVTDALVSSVRSAIGTPPGRVMRIADLSAIETRLGGWACSCEALNRCFADGRDPYIQFASLVYEKPYEEIDGFERFTGKPGTLGCFAADTLVLTDTGWKRIYDIILTDRLFDGIEWVSHDGLLAQGEKQVIDLAGVRLTSDHLILVNGKWENAEFIKSNRLLKSALSSASGLFSNLTHAEKKVATTFVDASAGLKNSSMDRIWNWKKATDVILAATEKHMLRAVRFMRAMRRKIESWLILLPIDITPSLADAALPDIAGTLGAASSANLLMSTNSLPTASRCQERAIGEITSIDGITTAITKKAICDSKLVKLTIAIKKFIAELPIWGKQCRQLFSTKNMRRNIGIPAQFVEKLMLVYREKKLSPNKSSAVVPTFDVLNCGPRSRFTILSNRGPLIAHNCMFMLSGGGEVGKYPDTQKTGLWAYAESMGLKLTRDQARHQVAVFREEYHEVKTKWYEFENALMETVNQRGVNTIGPISFDVMPPFARMNLPSGRHIYYLRPKVREQVIKHPDGEFVKWGTTYEGKNKAGKWTRVPTHGGKILENIVQATALDVLMEGMLAADEAGYDIVQHAHDEIVAECDVEDTEHTVDRLCELMSRPLDYLPDLMLGAEGFETDFYKKD